MSQARACIDIGAAACRYRTDAVRRNKITPLGDRVAGVYGTDRLFGYCVHAIAKRHPQGAISPLDRDARPGSDTDSETQTRRAWSLLFHQSEPVAHAKTQADDLVFGQWAAVRDGATKRVQVRHDPLNGFDARED
jgi:hypothetical protein